eukprot:snap_masked-scaffold_11-processed-gene-9.9-mRNA-1 protein AED:0.42 eAED:0.45 QI:0/0/0/1/1/1/2/0/2120
MKANLHVVTLIFLTWMLVFLVIGGARDFEKLQARVWSDDRVPSRKTPTKQPIRSPTSSPTKDSTEKPTKQPSRFPTSSPTMDSTEKPTKQPIRFPTSSPTMDSIEKSTKQPIRFPTSSPTMDSTEKPTKQPIRSPTSSPTMDSIAKPTKQPIRFPTSSPTKNSTEKPTKQPIRSPTSSPIRSPSQQPISFFTKAPTMNPTNTPVSSPSFIPSTGPTISPSGHPTSSSILFPTKFPTMNPSTYQSNTPTLAPTATPTTLPSYRPSNSPINKPTTSPFPQPTNAPFIVPTLSPTENPALLQTMAPTTTPVVLPSKEPSISPTFTPSTIPSLSPTLVPTKNPVLLFTQSPTIIPSHSPSLGPTTFLVSVHVDTQRTFAIIFSEEVRVSVSASCILRRDDRFGFEVIFFDVISDSVNLLQDTFFEENITIVGEKFFSLEGTLVGLLEEVPVTYPPQPVSGNLTKNSLSVLFDAEITVFGLNKIFVCSELFSLLLEENFERFDILDDIYVCTVETLVPKTLTIYFLGAIPFRRESEYLFIPKGSGFLKGATGIGSVFQEISLFSTLTITSFFHTLSTPAHLVPCHNTISILLEQTSSLPVVIDVEYSFSFVGINIEPIMMSRSGSLRTSLEELLYISPFLRTLLERNETVLIEVDGVVRGRYHKKILYSFSEDLKYSHTESQIQAQFRNGESLDVLTSEQVTISIDIAPVSRLCEIEQISELKTALFKHSCSILEMDEVFLAHSNNFLKTFKKGSSTLICTVSLGNSYRAALKFKPINITLSVTASHPLPVAKVQAEKFTVDVNKQVRISAEESCDPSLVPSTVCSLDLGFIGASNPETLLEDRGFIGNVEFLWSLKNSETFLPLGIGHTENLASGIRSGTEAMEEVIINSTDNPLKPVVLNLEPARSYTFGFDIIKSGSSTLTSMEIHVDTVSADSCELPLVGLSTLPERINLVDFNVQASVQNLANLVEVEFQWFIFAEEQSVDESLILVPVDVSSTVSTRESIFIPASVLSPDKNYTIEARVTNTCSNGNSVTAASRRKVSSLSPPAGGIVEVSQIQTFSLLQEYTVETLFWVDPDGDTLLEYSFHYAFLTPSERNDFVQNPSLHFSTSKTFPIIPFRKDNIATVYLPVPEDEQSLAVIAVAADSDGGVSRLLGLNAVFDVATNNTFLDINGQLHENISATVVEGFLEELFLNGRSREIPYACRVIASQLNAANGSPNPTSTNIRDLCLAYSMIILDMVDDEGTIDLTFLNQVADGYNALTAAVEELSTQALFGLSADASRVTSVLYATIEEKSNNFKDPFSPGLLANSIREGVFGILSNSVNLIDRDDSVSSSNLTTTRILYQTASSCEVALSSETIIRQLSNLSNAVVPNGAPAYSVNTNNFEFFSARERDREIGGENRVSGFVFSNGENSVTFGTGLNANGERVFGSTSQDVNVYAVNWNRNIRCDRGLTPPIEDICLPNITFSGPVGDDPAFISNTLTVEILSRGSELNKIAVEGVNDAISLVLDKHDSSQTVSLPDTCADKSPCGILLEKETACGVYEKRINDWDSVGCEVVTSAKTSPGTVECRCSHLSNYASFYAFKKDLIQIGEPIVCESALAITRTTYAGNLYFLFGFCLIGWSFYDDKYDSQQVQKAAVARITLIRVLQRHQKRKLFRNFENRLNFVDSEGQRTSSTIIIDQPPKNQTKALFLNFLKALRYEHSLFSIGKFDPNYSKLQRTAVFLTVILGNFAVSAVFFNLIVKGGDLPVWFILIVGLVCALCVAVPIKIFMKVLFRTTENFIGSVNDICANSTKILTRLEEGDGRLLPSDNQLIDNYRQLLWASTCLNANEANSSAGSLNSLISSLEPAQQTEHLNECRVVHYLEEHERGENLPAVEVIEELHERVYEATVVAREIWDRANIEPIKHLAATNSTREICGKIESEMSHTDIPVAFYTLEWQRVLAAESQGQSRVKRLLAILSETTPARRRSRKSSLSANFIYFDCATLIILIGGLLFFSAYFVLSRFQDIAEEGNYTYQNISFIREKEDEEFYSWLNVSIVGVILSYVVAEPIALWFRFFLAPLCVVHFGNDKFIILPGETSDALYSRTSEAMTLLRTYGSIRSSNSSVWVEYLADIVENLV